MFHGMNTTRMALALVVALSFVGAADSKAQRRTADGGGGGGGDTRSTPSSSGGSGGSSTPSRGRDGGSSGGSSSGGCSTCGPVYSRPSSSGSYGGSSGSSSGFTDRRGAQNSSGARTANGTAGTSGNRPQTGKIGAIKKAAQAARNRPAAATGGGVFIGACWSCNYWGWYGDQWGVYDGGWWYPANYPPPDYYPADGYAGGGKGGGSDQGYQPYPYAGADSTNETFAQRHASVRRSYGAVTMTYFSDAGSTTKAGEIGLEGAIGQVRGELEYAHYAEPVIGHTDHLQTLRFGLAAQPRLSSNAYLIAGVAARGVFLDDGSRAWGPEGELGLQVFPMRPFGLNVTERLAGLSWNGNDYFLFQELNTTGSVFINRIEIQGGWHWLKIGGSPAFGGPVLGMRVWF
jgi:hypothetical protein